MKKVISILLFWVLPLMLAGCGNATPAGGQKDISEPTQIQAEETSNSEQADTEAKESETLPSVSEPEQEADMEHKTLVVYFSATGTTEPLAEYAAEILGADIYEIVPEQPYTEADLAYYTNGRADQEQNDPNARPVISGNVENMDEYDTLILGYPIWHGQAPRIISTFLESYDFSGKTIVPFCTSHSSGIGSSADNLHELRPDSVNWLDGKRFEAGTSKEVLEEWLGSLGIK